MKALRPVASRLGLRSSIARRSEPLGKLNATARAVEGNLGGFCVRVASAKTKKRPRRGLRAEAACVGTSGLLGQRIRCRPQVLGPARDRHGADHLVSSIDDAAGLIRLTTTLAHSSGEWVSSDWPASLLEIRDQVKRHRQQERRRSECRG